MRNTWTHKFICLANTQSAFTPSYDEKEILRLAGLGEKTVTFSKTGDSNHDPNKLIAAFPKLSGAGGYQILRASSRKSLEPLGSNPPHGSTVTFLKNSLGQAKAYIRPLWMTLSTTPSRNPADEADVSTVYGLLASIQSTYPRIEQQELKKYYFALFDRASVILIP